MLRFMLAVGLSVSGFFGMAATSRAQDRPASSLVPDLAWRPSPGDRVVVRLPDSPAFPDVGSCERYIKSSRAGDAAGIREVTSGKAIGKLAANTPILVVQAHGLPNRRGGSTVTTPDELQTEVQDAIIRAASQPKAAVTIEARILDGPMKDSLRFIPMDSLAKMIPGRPTPVLSVGSRAVVVASSVPMGRDEETFLQYVRHPEEPDNRPYAVPLAKGARVTILQVNARTYRVKVHSNSRLAGRVGYLTPAGLELAETEATKAKGKAGPK